MKDHEKRDLVSDLTVIALNYRSAQQLRERIACRLLPELDAPAAPSCAELGALAEAAGMVNLLNQGAASCVHSEGCNGVTQEHLEKFVALARATATQAEEPSTDTEPKYIAGLLRRAARLLPGMNDLELLELKAKISVAASRLEATSRHPAAQPLSDAEILAGSRAPQANQRSGLEHFTAGVRFAEAHHSIAQRTAQPIGWVLEWGAVGVTEEGGSRRITCRALFDTKAEALAEQSTCEFASRVYPVSVGPHAAHLLSDDELMRIGVDACRGRDAVVTSNGAVVAGRAVMRACAKAWGVQLPN